MKNIFIINPLAGKEKNTQDFVKNIQKACKKLKKEYEIIICEKNEDIIKIVKDICQRINGEKRFFAVGGDGTLSKVVNGSMGFSEVSVGVIPNGTGNDYIKNFTDDKKIFLDIEKQLTAKTIKTDLIKCNDKICVNMINIGFDANVSAVMPRFKALPLVSNKLAYTLSIFYNVIKKLGSKLEIKIDDKLIHSGKMLMTSVSGGISCGGGFYLTPYAKVDDGILDLAIVSVPSRLLLLPFMKNISEKTQFEKEPTKSRMKYFTAQKVNIKAKKTQVFSIDGEMYNFDELDIVIEKLALNFVLPQ